MPALHPEVEALLELSRKAGARPFEDLTPEQARAAADLTDGIVVGSRAVQVAEDGPDALGAYIASLRAALDA